MTFRWVKNTIEIIEDVTKKYNIPSYTFPGHIQDNRALILGNNVTISIRKGRWF
jgi:muramoyltetrapeptide carboxypeptidase